MPFGSLHAKKSEQKKPVISYAIKSDNNNSVFDSSNIMLSVCLHDVMRWTFGQSEGGHVDDQIKSAVYSDHMYISSVLLMPHTASLVTYIWTMLYNKDKITNAVIMQQYNIAGVTSSPTDLSASECNHFPVQCSVNTLDSINVVTLR